MHKSTELPTVGSVPAQVPSTLKHFSVSLLCATLSPFLSCFSIGNNLWGKLHADIQQMSSSATPCSRMNFVSVFLGLLDLQDGKVKENLEKKVEESRCRRISQSFLTSFCPSMKEEQNSQAYKTLK